MPQKADNKGGAAGTLNCLSFLGLYFSGKEMGGSLYNA